MKAIRRFRIFNLRHATRHWVRTALSMGLALMSSALIVAVLSTFGSLSGSVERFAKSVAGEASVAVVGITESGFPASQLEEIRTSPGVQSAVPLIQASVSIENERVSLFGVDDSVEALSSELKDTVAGIDESELTSGGIVIGGEVASSLDIGPEDEVEITTPEGIKTTLPVSVVVDDGAASSINSGRFVVVPLELAQQLLGRAGMIDAIYIVADQGSEKSAIVQRLTDITGDTAYVGDVDYQARQADKATAIARDSTLIVAVLAVIAATFLIFTSSFSSLRKRQAEIATLLVLGSPRQRIFRSYVVEAATTALAGAIIGACIGALAGSASVAYLPPVLTAGFDYRITYTAAWWEIAVGIGLAVVAAAAAAAVVVSRILELSLSEALRGDGAAGSQTSRRSKTAVWFAAAGLCTIASVTIFVAAPDLAALSLSTALLGMITLCVACTGLITAVVAWLINRTGSQGQIVGRALSRDPRRAWAIVMTVAVAASVGVATTGSTSDLLTSADRSVSSLKDADFFVQGAVAEAFPTTYVFSDEQLGRLARLDGVDEVNPGQLLRATVQGHAVTIQGASARSKTPMVANLSDAARDLVMKGQAVALSKKAAETFDVEVGDLLQIPTPTGIRELPVAETVAYPSLNEGQIVLGIEQVQDWFERPGSTFFEVNLDDSASHAAVAEQIATAFNDSTFAVHVLPGESIFLATSASIQQTALLARAIQAIVLGVAALAMMNTMTMAVIDRRRELGIVRAIGSTRSEMRRMVLVEAAGLALVGAALGLAMGVVLHSLANLVLADSLALNVPLHVGALSFAIAAASCLVVVAGAIAPAHAASRVEPARIMTGA